MEEIRLLRIELLTKNGNKLEAATFKAIDAMIIPQFFKQHLDSDLKLLYSQLRIIDFGTIYNFKLLNNNFSLKVPNKNKLTNLELYYSFKFVVNYFNFSDFYYIYWHILKEYSVIFVSNVFCRISYCINCFINLIKPLIWNYPVIYSLSYQLFTILSKNIPYIIGINNDINFIYENVITKINKPNVLIVLIDHNKIILKENKQKNVRIAIPNNLLKNGIANNYSYINNSPGNFIIKTDNNQYYLSESNEITTVNKKIASNNIKLNLEQKKVIKSILQDFKINLKSILKEFITFEKEFIKIHKTESCGLENILTEYYSRKNDNFIKNVIESELFFNYLEAEGIIKIN